MTKAFLEPIVLKPKNEDLVRKAFSKESLNKVRRPLNISCQNNSDKRNPIAPV